jgi:hypothetical protein
LLDLFEQVVRGADVCFPLAGRPVLRRAALHDIGDEDLLTADPGPFQDMVQESTGGADEGSAGFVLVTSWGFTDDHDASERLSLAWDGMLAGFAQRTLRANADLAGQFFQALDFRGDCTHGKLLSAVL